MHVAQLELPIHWLIHEALVFTSAAVISLEWLWEESLKGEKKAKPWCFRCKAIVIIFSLRYTKLIVTSSNCGSPCFVFLIRVTYNINPWWIIDCQVPSERLNVERRYSNGISGCPLCNYGRPLHPSKDWKVSSATLSYCLSTQTTAYISWKTTWDTDFCWACVACTQQKMKASQQAKQLFLIWTFQERREPGMAQHA